MLTLGDTKTYQDRPAGQPVYVPSQYVRPAPGGFVEALVMPHGMAEYVAEVARRWRGASPDKESNARQ